MASKLMIHDVMPSTYFDGRGARRAHDALLHTLLVDPARLAAHSRRVGQLSARLAMALGLDREASSSVGLACTFHDIGKLALPQTVLALERGLTGPERTLVRRHAELGSALLSLGDGPLMRLAAAVALAHHEAFDGTGYPLGLAGEAIPLPARICCVADTYDALREDRPYRKGLAHAEALGIMVEGDGRMRAGMFDPLVLEALMAIDAQQIFAQETLTQETLTRENLTPQTLARENPALGQDGPVAGRDGPAGQGRAGDGGAGSGR